MSRLEAQAERIKLARLLDVPESRLHFLEAVDAASLRAIRETASAVIFDDARATLTRVATASKLLPVAMVALVGERIFGSMLCARIAGLIAPQRALEVSLRLSDAFLARVASQIDPRSAHEVIAGIPLPRVQAVAALLIARGDYVTMGRFVDYLSRDTIRGVIDTIRDNAVLLHVAFYVEDKTKLDDLIDLLPPARLLELVRLSGHADTGVWPEALALMNQVSPQWRGRIGDLTASEDTAFLGGLLQLTQQGDLWDAMLPVIGCMSAAHRHRLAQLPALADVAVLRSIIASAHGVGLWAELLPFVSHMPAPTRRAAAQVMEHLPHDILLGLIAAANAQGLWPDLIRILADMDGDEKRQIVQLIGAQDDAVLEQLLQAVDAGNLWGEVLPLVGLMGERARKTAARLVPTFPAAVLQRLIAAAERLNLWAELLAILQDMAVGERQAVLRLILQQDDAELHALVAAVQGGQLWSRLLPLLQDLPDADLQRLIALLPQNADRASLEASARKLGLWPGLQVLLSR